ncbi:c-type cytochrome [Thiohalomonas denitrificans]|uniref:Cytochrome C oxidase, cbb3-type, subunit III n=1 Tax=Thiohalomonas denitrificans TaxID=415747 RepID=A0A1G5QJF2_9GAMM|nr:cytochrome c [Thiohalomonas denitrificans]SCZ61680.1 Cytochrome C oxidase, cbb3-type, subunit III [Thiohalomonas denitrificans]
MHYPYSIAIVSLALLLSACSSETETGTSLASGEAVDAPVRDIDFSRVARGGNLYQQNCASCHGVDGEGAPNWRERDVQGFFPAPPLNGTGHTWHHPRRMLQHVIKNGSPGGGQMPAWQGRLSDEEIDSIIDWFQSRWPDEVYAAWQEMETRSRQAAR